MRARRPALSQTVHIVLATYDGAPWLEAQVRSLQAQEHRAWRLLARDDGSGDGTQALLVRLAREEPRLAVLPPGPRLGAVGNFGAVLEAARAEGARWVAPCDQDDVWRPDKLKRLLAAMAALEARHGPAAPLLVHSDLEVVDGELRTLRPSLLAGLGHRRVEGDVLAPLLAQNFVTGCAALCNRALLDLALPIPPGAAMHDWWLALCAAAAGAVGFEPAPTVRYRVHGGNQVGASGPLAAYSPLRADGRRRLGEALRAGRRGQAQARLLLARLEARAAGGAEARRLVEAFGRLGAAPPWRRLATLRRLGVRRPGALGTALLWAELALAAGASPVASPGHSE